MVTTIERRLWEPMTKLVRDGYKSNHIPSSFTLRPVSSRQEHVDLLLAKIKEELAELLMESTSLGGALEAGDLIEAIFAYCQVKWGLTEEQVTAVRDSKRERLGGFIEGKVWIEG